MDIGFKKTSSNSAGKWTFYIVLIMCLTAAGIGSYSMLKNSADKAETSTAVDWDNQGGTVAPTAKAAVPATSVADPRQFTETEGQTSSTAPPAVVTDNLPFTGDFALPLGTDILKDYSNGEVVPSKTMGDWRVHNGIDFSGSAESDVLAIQDGTVIKVYDDAFWGTVVLIDHENSMFAKYCGIDKETAPAVGSNVKKGSKIGRLSEIPIEAADELHLHLEITVDSKIVDPLAAMNRAD